MEKEVQLHLTKTRHGLSNEPSTEVLRRPQNFLKMGINYLNLSSFGQYWQQRTKSLLQSFIIQKLSATKLLRSQLPWVVSIYWQLCSLDIWTQRDRPLIASTCVAHTSPQRSSRDVIASLASVRLTAWPVAWNWRRAVLSADAGFLVDWHYYHKRQSRP